MADYVPHTDLQYSEWLGTFITILTPHTLTLGLTAPDITALDGTKMLFDTARADHIAKQGAAKSATELKNNERATSVAMLRSIVRRIQAHPAMTDDLRVALGLPVRDDSQTTSTGPGEEVPEVCLETRQSQVIVHFGTTPLNEQTNGKPSWAMGCNIYRKRTGEDDFTLVAFETSSPYVDEIIGPAAEYWYCARYRGRKASDLGGPSAPVSIAASGLLAA